MVDAGDLTSSLTIIYAITTQSHAGNRRHNQHDAALHVLIILQAQRLPLLLSIALGGLSE